MTRTPDTCQIHQNRPQIAARTCLLNTNKSRLENELMKLAVINFQIFHNVLGTFARIEQANLNDTASS